MEPQAVVEALHVLEYLRRDLQARLSDYVWWHDNERLHSTLNYTSPVEFRLAGLSL